MCTIQYTPGKCNTLADALSRQEWRFTEEADGNRPEQRVPDDPGGAGLSDGAGGALQSRFSAGGCEGPAFKEDDKDKDKEGKRENRDVQINKDKRENRDVQIKQDNRENREVQIRQNKRENREVQIRAKTERTKAPTTDQFMRLEART